MFLKLLFFLRSLSDHVNTFAEYLLSFIVLAMSSLILVQVFFRYALNDSLFWSEELGRMLLVWLTFIGASIAYKRCSHVGISFFVQKFRPTIRVYFSCLTHIATASLSFVMLFYGALFFSMLAPQMTVSLGFSRQIPFLAVPLSGGIFLIHAINFLFSDISTIFTSKNNSESQA